MDQSKRFFIAAQAIVLGLLVMNIALAVVIPALLGQ